MIRRYGGRSLRLAESPASEKRPARRSRGASATRRASGSLCSSLLEALILVFSASGLIACHADTAEESTVVSSEKVYRRHHVGSTNDFDSSAGAKAMGLQNEVGVYDSSDINDVINESFADVRGCYNKAGHARRYVGGKLVLRFEVDGTGKPTDVLLIQNALGNYEVERCLFHVAMSLRFPPPIGNKATTFEYPLEFKSTREMPVQDLDSPKVDRDVVAYRSGLAACGKVSDAVAQAVFYIEPSGRIGSVGLQSRAHVDSAAAQCVISQILRWRMSATLPGRALRCRATLPSAASGSMAMSTADWRKRSAR
jgi:hypothetical protein